MSIDQFVEKQKRVFEAIIKNDLPLRYAAYSTTAKMASRIFVEGKNSSGSDIGRYNSTDPLYVNPKKTAGAASRLGAPRGKTGETRFKNGKPHKTVFVSSYKDLKGKIGQPNDKVRLVYSGDLRSDFSNSKSLAEPIKVNEHEYIVGLKRKINAQKAEGLENKFGVIFSPAAQERRNFFDIASKEFNRIIANA